jgi:hypothetical protein
MTEDEKLEELLKNFETSILEIVGREFAPKQKGGSPERKRLLGLVADIHPELEEAKLAIKRMLLEARKDELDNLPRIEDSNHIEDGRGVTISDSCIECHIRVRKAALDQLNSTEEVI